MRSDKEKRAALETWATVLAIVGRAEAEGTEEETRRQGPWCLVNGLEPFRGHEEGSSPAGGPYASTVFLITTAVEGHADRNSTDICTLAGTSERAIRTNPNRGKNASAVVVSR
jgi:hypothetical protein